MFHNSIIEASKMSPTTSSPQPPSQQLPLASIPSENDELLGEAKATGQPNTDNTNNTSVQQTSSNRGRGLTATKFAIRDGGPTGPLGVRSGTRSPTRQQPTGNIREQEPAEFAAATGDQIGGTTVLTTPADKKQTPEDHKVRPNGRLEDSRDEMLQPSDSWYASPSSGGLNPQTPAYNNQTPGAHKVRPSGRMDESSSELTAFQKSERSAATGDVERPSQIGGIPILTAVMVEDKEEVVNESLPLAVAQKDSCWGFLKQNRRAQLVVFLFAFTLIGMAVGLGIAFGKDEDKSGKDESKDSFEPVGNMLVGPDEEMRYGASISLSQDGKRMAIADKQTVQIFGLKTPEDAEDEEVWEILMDIEANHSLHSENEMIRAPVVVDISRDGKYVAIGWPFASGSEDDTNEVQPTNNKGRVEVYQENPSSTKWERLGNIIFGEAPEDFFGCSVSLSGKGGELAVAAGGSESDEPVRVYLLNDGKWIPRGDNITIGGTMWLGSVSLSADGSVLAVGGTTTNIDENPASVRIFEFLSGGWVERGEGVIGELEGSTAYQAALSADGMIVAVSNYYVGSVGAAEAKSNDALDARALEWLRDQKKWIPLGENLHASAPGAKTGYFISLSDDGKIIAMGDPGTPGESGGGVTGHAHIYKYDDDGGSWMQFGPNQNGTAAGDEFGFDVSISGNGRQFAVGAPGNRFGGPETGQVYVYAIDDE
jgi:WD40 repeat protein